MQIIFNNTYFLVKNFTLKSFASCLELRYVQACHVNYFIPKQNTTKMQMVFNYNTSIPSNFEFSQHSKV